MYKRQQIVHNSKFLMSALYTLGNEGLITLLNENGLQTRVERGGRVFPQSDRSNDVIKTMLRLVRTAGAHLRLDTAVKRIEKQEETFIV